MFKQFLKKILNIEEDFKQTKSSGEEEDTGVTVLPCKIKIPVRPTIFNIKFEDISHLRRVKIFSPGIIFSKGMYKNECVGVKVFNVTFTDDFPQFFRQLYKESQKYLKTEHPNLAKLYGVYHDYPRFGIVQEYYHRNLASLIRTGQKIKWIRKIEILLDISKAMMFLHEHTIFHRFLSCENVFFNKENKVVVNGPWMSEFEDTQNRERRIKKYGAYYQAPEHTLDNQETMKSDVFSFAILMFELLTEQLNPFGDMVDVASKLAQDPTLRPSIPTDFKFNKENAWYIDLMNRAWEFYPHRRPHFQDIVRYVTEKYNEVVKQKKDEKE